LRFIAAELMEVVSGRSEMLLNVQRDILVPLENELMAKGDLTASELVRSTRAALRSNIA
jgi:hypothetical protein